MKKVKILLLTALAFLFIPKVNAYALVDNGLDEVMDEQTLAPDDNSVQYAAISTTETTMPLHSMLYLSARYYPSDADNVKTVVWSSSKPRVATVSKAGKVTALKPGKTIIKYTVNGNITAECEIVVSKNSIIKSKGRYYLVNKKGKKLKNRWVSIGQSTYYFGKKRYAVKGFQKIAGHTYYFNKKFIMVKDWQTISGKTYYFGDDGIMVTGKQVIDEEEYTFTSKGVLLDD